MSNSLPSNPFINSLYPFAINGSKGSSISDSDGDINRSIGFGEKFSKLISDGGKFVDRGNINRLFFELYNALMYFQQGGLSVFNQNLANAIGGYASGAKLAFYNSIYGEWTIIESLENNNVTSPIADETAATNVDNGSSSKWRTVLPVRDINGTRTITGNFELINAQSAKGCPEPTNPDHFANKGYVDKTVYLSNDSHFNVIEGASTYPRYVNVDSSGKAWTAGSVHMYTISRDCLLLIEVARESTDTVSLRELSVHLDADPTDAFGNRCIYSMDGSSGMQYTGRVHLKGGTNIYVRLGRDSNQSNPSVRLTEIYNEDTDLT